MKIQAAVSLLAAALSAAAGVVQPFVDRGELAGAVMLVASRDRVLAMETAGWADIAAQRPMPPDAVFWIASQTKAMTAAALMLLVDEGKVKLDDPVGKYLPEFRDQMVVVEKDAEHMLLRKPARPMTVRDTLCHISGLPFKSPIEEPALDLYPLAVRVRSYALPPLPAEPGRAYQYSNEGINTAGRIIEVVSGLRYEDFMDRRLFEPLGMTNTTFRPSAAQVARLAKTYRPNAAKDGLEESRIGQLTYPLTDRQREPMPAGGLFSTAGDVARFCQLILNDGLADGRRLLSAESVRQLTTRQTPAELKESYGLGFAVGDGWCGHGGAQATHMHIDLRRGLVLVWMVQHAGFPGKGGQAQEAFKRDALERFAPALP